MKRLIYVFLPFLMISGCNLFDLQTHVTSGNGYSKYSHEKSGDGGSSEPVGECDTIVWFSAVEYPEDYDWKMDSSYGNVDARIILYRNFEPVISVPADGNPAQDRHHIFGGCLYSEAERASVTGPRTCFMRDGITFLDVDGLCTLSGIMNLDGIAYALVRPMSSSGFTLYKDGVAIFSSASGHLCGGPSVPAYSSGGALYSDEGKCTFCYWTTDDHYGRVWHCVRESTEIILDDTYRNAVSIRMIDGKAVPSMNFQGGRLWEESYVWNIGQPVISGVTNDAGNSACSVYWPDSSVFLTICPEDGSVYLSDASERAVCRSEGGAVSIYSCNGVRETVDGLWQYVYPSCAALVGEKLLLALNPENPATPSVVYWGERSFNIDVNGFITNVSYTRERK